MRVVNLGRPTATPAYRPVMGQLQSEALKAATASVDDAKAIVGRVTATYGKLVQMMGPEDAKQAYDQAVDSLKKAQQQYDDLLSLSKPFLKG